MATEEELSKLVQVTASSKQLALTMSLCDWLYNANPGGKYMVTEKWDISSRCLTLALTLAQDTYL